MSTQAQTHRSNMKILSRISQYKGIVTHWFTDGTTEEISVVNIPDRIKYLERQHKQIHNEVEKLTKVNPYDPAIKARKSEKLMIKDEIERLVARYESDSGIEYFG
jgi:hypothetical protein